MPGGFKAAIGAAQPRAVAVGGVTAAPTRVYWIACTPSAPNAEWALTDDTDGLSAVVYEHFDTDKESEQIPFDPPLEFKKALYVKTFDNMTSLVFSLD